MVAPVSSTSLTGQTYVDSLLWGGQYWNQSANGGEIEYSFWGSGSESFDDPYDNITNTAYNWLSYEKTAMQNALQQWSNVANINFVQSSDNDESATLGFYSVDSDDFGSYLGMFNPPGEDGMGIGYFNWDVDSWNYNDLQQGGSGFVTLIHELGHGLGLAHPHDSGGGSSIFPGVDSPWDSGTYGLNQGIWTTMSYIDGLESDGLGSNLSYGYQGTPMALDIAAIQHLYGANMSYKTGNDTYTLPEVNDIGTFYSCIWDAGGIDKISNFGSNIASVINLNDAPLTGANAGGYLSTPNGIYGGFTIANGVVIENATGGNGNDTITALSRSEKYVNIC